MRVALFAEGVFETLHTFQTEREAQAFVCGAETASSVYGGIGCASVYIMPADLGRMRQVEDADQVKRALVRLTEASKEGERLGAHLDARTRRVLVGPECPRCGVYHSQDDT